MLTVIRTIEELSMNARPALRTLLYDGWVVRFAHGFTKRANSVNPIYVSSVQVEEKIRFCEHFYREESLPVMFKMTPAASPDDLDKRLARRRYRLDSPTSVQILDLTNSRMSQISVSSAIEELSEEWLASFARLSGTRHRDRNTLRQLLTSIATRRGFFFLRRDRRVVACGMGVVQDSYVGIFDVVVDPKFRHLGYGMQLMLDVLGWGRKHGARTAYLQVLLDNAPALHLYSKLGFKENYRYWYRIRT
jgi:ribosomal protein S18 acetylase RimI-like enzyme